MNETAWCVLHHSVAERRETRLFESRDEMADARRLGEQMTVAPRMVPASRRGALREAAEALAGGGVVAFPTETVYGLGVRAGDAGARRRLARVKGGRGSKPFQILVSSRTRAMELCGRMPATARRFAEALWPGPLTLVLRGAHGRWVGLRVPDHDVARRLTRMAGGAVVATSANRSGHAPARTAAEVIEALGDRIDMVLDGGAAGRGKASSVVRVREDGWELLRDGAIPQRKLVKVSGMAPCRKGTGR